MSDPFLHIANLASEMEPPTDGIHTRTLLNNDSLKAVIFGFAPGEELSEHTASMPAILHFISGEATLTLGDETCDAGPGTWIQMEAGLQHSVRASSSTVMLLLLLKHS